MDTTTFVRELEAQAAERLAPLLAAGQVSIGGGAGDPQAMLQIALANEINVSELAATWMPSTREVEVKIALARQAGDEAGHFQLVAGRLAALGVDVSTFEPPASPLFDYMRTLPTTVERIAAGLFTLEAIAYGVNQNFMAFCEARGDAETVRIYREYIQPDERGHHELGQRLLAAHATSSDLQRIARDTVHKVVEIARASRATAAEKLGTACFPGC